jgi:dienelactone hydrolase
MARPAGARIAVVVVSLLCTVSASAQQRIVVLPFESVSLSPQQILLGETRGKPVTLAGELRLPRGVAERVPAVILVHGMHGIMDNQDEWARALNEWGVAAFIIDNYSGRGINANTADAYRLGLLPRMVDAYRALAVLVQQPHIDRERIAVMGFSMGTGAAIFSAAERFRALYGPPGATFAAHIALYPLCMIRLREDTKVSAQPIRLFHGTRDDWTPIESCRAFVTDMKKAGANVTLTEFEGATHAYDLVMKGRVTLPDAYTMRKCSLAEGDGGQVLNTKTGQPFSFMDPCLEQGVTLQYDEGATTATRQAVKATLASVFSTRPPAAQPAPAPSAQAGSK